MAAIQLKNTLKRVYGSTLSYNSYDDKEEQKKGEELQQNDLLDDEGKQVLQASFVPLMLQLSGSGKTKVANIVLECISTMARRFVQSEWPELFPSLI